MCACQLEMWGRQFGIRRVTVIGEKREITTAPWPELGDKVSGQPRESFRLCVPRIPWESNTNSSGNPTLLCAHEHEHALIGWRHERSPVFRIRRAARTKHETRSTASRALLLFRRTKNRNVLYSRLDYIYNMALSPLLIFFVKML